MRTRRRTRELVLGFARAAVIGLCGGLASLGFRAATLWCQKFSGIGEDVLEGAREMGRSGQWWLLIATPAIGALIAALIMKFVVRGGPGAGLSVVMEAVSLKSGPIKFRSALTRSIASMGIIATGGSVGREGPIIALSAAASSVMTRWMRAPARDRGVLLGCGVAAGFSAAYNAPIAGALFAMEVVLGNFAMELFAPVVVASVTATLFTWTVKGHQHPVYEIPAFKMESLWELVPYLALGIASGVVAVGFQRLLVMSERGFAKLPGGLMLRMVVGGVLIGTVAIWYPEVWGNGYESVSEILNPEGTHFDNEAWPILAGGLFVLAIVKALGTAITVGSGGSGGVFTPTLFIGAGLGGCVGVLVDHFAWHGSQSFGGYALVGMGCMVAGTTRAPIMAIIVMYEMTRNYDIVAPLMLGCITASLVAQSIYPLSIYTEELRARGVKQPVGLEETVLVTTRVADVMRAEPLTWVDQATTYGEIIPLATAARASVVYVCGAERVLRGSIRIHDLIELASMQDLGPSIIAADLMTASDVSVASDRLSDVFDLFENSDLGELPVVDANGILEGVVTRKDVMAALHIEVLKRQNLRAKFVHKDDSARGTDYVELPKGVELARVPVLPRHVGRTLGACNVRVKHRVTVVSVIRRDESGKELRILADGDFVMQAGDELIVLGALDDIGEWRQRVASQAESGDGDASA